MSGRIEKGRLGIIAGGGALPLYVANAARASGEDPFVVQLKREADYDYSIFDGVIASIGDYRSIDGVLGRVGADRVILSGSIKHRPDWSEIRPSFDTLLKLPMVLKTLVSGGDDAVLRMAIALLEKDGRKVIGPHEVVPGLLAQKGRMSGPEPSKNDLANIAVASNAARRIGDLDIGQGAVAVGGRVVALEGPEGTDAMLRRVALLRAEGRISKKKPGVLVKLCKRQQDMRADLPTIGCESLENAKAAGLTGIAVEAGKSFVLDREKLFSAAEASGLFIFGIEPDIGEGEQ